jgi:hypothetical protein
MSLGVCAIETVGPPDASARSWSPRRFCAPYLSSFDWNFKNLGMESHPWYGNGHFPNREPFQTIDPLTSVRNQRITSPPIGWLDRGWISPVLPRGRVLLLPCFLIAAVRDGLNPPFVPSGWHTILLRRTSVVADRKWTTKKGPEEPQRSCHYPKHEIPS